VRRVTTLRLGLPTEQALTTQSDPTQSDSTTSHYLDPHPVVPEIDLEAEATPDVDMLSPIAEPKTFAELGVLQATVDALAADGIITAFPIQELTLPLALAGTDLIGQAKTGTGKTLGFGIPALQRLIAPTDEGFDEQPDNVKGKPQALVVVPTRELGIQVASDLEKAGRLRGVRVLCVYGGRAYEPQVEALAAGIEVVVGTPGRLIDLARQGHLSLKHVKTLVLDEADEMLDMGFLPDVERIVALVPPVRQTMLFSATMPGKIVALARRYMTQPTHIRAIDAGNEHATVDAIEQHVYRAHNLDKNEIIARALQSDGRGLTMIFCRTKRNAQRVADDLVDRGFAAAAVHGDLGQGAREQALRAFRNGKVDVLVATDVAARGIDVADVTHVINWECPDDEKTYLHRIGRTGRAGKDGVAITLVDWDDMHRWKMINEALGLAFAEPVETYSSSPHLYTGLGIPEGTKGRLPKSEQKRAGLDAEVIEDLGETGASAGKRAKHDKPRSDRDSGRNRSDKARGDKPRGEKAHSERSEERSEPRPPRDRQRRRTRGGSSADAAGSAAHATDEKPAASGADPSGSEPADSDGAPRRRRRRGGRGRGGSSASSTGTAESSAPTD
jgi:superfamily II DNA/RNA helicase